MASQKMAKIENAESEPTGMAAWHGVAWHLSAARCA